MTCLLCGHRKAKRACPGVGHDICTVCCGTKRLKEIRCPPDCVYLDAAQRHPAAAVKRQLEIDAAVLREAIGSASDEHLQLYFVLQSFITRFAQDATPPITDADVAGAAAALAEGYEVAAKGLVYDPPAASLGAEGLRRELKTFLDQIGKKAPPRFEREAAFVLRAIERAARHEVVGLGSGPIEYLTLAARILSAPSPTLPRSSSLILP